MKHESNCMCDKCYKAALQKIHKCPDFPKETLDLSFCCDICGGKIDPDEDRHTVSRIGASTTSCDSCFNNLWERKDV